MFVSFQTPVEPPWGTFLYLKFFRFWVSSFFFFCSQYLKVKILIIQNKKQKYDEFDTGIKWLSSLKRKYGKYFLRIKLIRIASINQEIDFFVKGI